MQEKTEKIEENIYKIKTLSITLGIRALRHIILVDKLFKI